MYVVSWIYDGLFGEEVYAFAENTTTAASRMRRDGCSVEIIYDPNRTDPLED